MPMHGRNYNGEGTNVGKQRREIFTADRYG
jgi:hypothetical protein